MPASPRSRSTLDVATRYQSGFMHELAAQLSLRWWDTLEDCAPEQANQTECDSWNEHGKEATARADFDANWERPFSRALVAMRKPNSTKGALRVPKVKAASANWRYR